MSDESDIALYTVGWVRATARVAEADGRSLTGAEVLSWISDARACAPRDMPWIKPDSPDDHAD